MRLFLAVVALFLVVVVAACEPTVGVNLNGYPECPTTAAEYFNRTTVPLGCPLPADSLLLPTMGR